MESLKKALNPVPMWALAGSGPWFGAGIGRRKLKKLHEVYGRVVDLTIQEIVAVEGFEEKSALAVMEGFKPFKEFLVSIYGYYTEEVKKVVTDGKLTGQIFVFTGFRDKDAEKRIEELGGKIGSSIAKNTTYLVCKDPTSTSSKMTKARSLGVKVISPNELRDVIR
jgi:NAD-dependent DNA ligase